MIAVGEGDECRASRMVARDLDGILDRLAASRKEQRLLREIAGTKRIQPLSERDVAFIGADLKAGMGEVIELSLDRLDHLLMAMADILATDAAAKVDIALAGDIPDFGVVSVLRREGRRIGNCPGDTVIAAFLEFFVGGHIGSFFRDLPDRRTGPPVGVDVGEESPVTRAEGRRLPRPFPPAAPPYRRSPRSRSTRACHR